MKDSLYIPIVDKSKPEKDPEFDFQEIDPLDIIDLESDPSNQAKNALSIQEWVALLNELFSHKEVLSIVQKKENKALVKQVLKSSVPV